MFSGSDCPKCHSFVKDHSNRPGSYKIATQELYPNLYGRICPRCKSYVPSRYKPRFVIENEEKLKLLQEEVREHIRAQAARRKQMAIDQAHVNMEFKYVADNIEGVEFFVRYHHIGEHPTISLSEDGNEWSPLPASLFYEVIDFIQQNSFGPSAAQQQPPAPPPQQPPPFNVRPMSQAPAMARYATAPQQPQQPQYQQPAPPPRQSGLPMPQINGQHPTVAAGMMPAANMEPLQSPCWH